MHTATQQPCEVRFCNHLVQSLFLWKSVKFINSSYDHSVCVAYSDYRNNNCMLQCRKSMFDLMLFTAFQELCIIYHREATLLWGKPSKRVLEILYQKDNFTKNSYTDLYWQSHRADLHAQRLKYIAYSSDNFQYEIKGSFIIDKFQTNTFTARGVKIIGCFKHMSATRFNCTLDVRLFMVLFVFLELISINQLN